MKKLSIKFANLFLGLNLFGLAVSIFLWSSTYSRTVALCLTGGCEAVLLSPYARIFGIPIAVWGAVFYIVGVIVSLFRLLDDRPVHRLFLWGHGILSIFASAYFLYLELFKIHAICSWCKLSTLTTILLLTISIMEIKKFGGFKNAIEEIKSLFQ